MNGSKMVVFNIDLCSGGDDARGRSPAGGDLSGGHSGANTTSLCQFSGHEAHAEQGGHNNKQEKIY